ncbi:hypothetical protein KEM48_001261 [Puccinia striiformis f. sp. tritici PST-130]|nr:hypothetical protein KEM48_001261 [Puccinia striiformis f. sp. tritici PST-130]
MSTEDNTLNSQLPFPSLGASTTPEMAGSSNNDGFRQAMLKTALETTPQLLEENYSVRKDKMTALLETQASFHLKNRQCNSQQYRLGRNWGSAKALWKAIKDRFASNESSNRARVFNDFLYAKFKEDHFEVFVTDIKVAINKLVNVGIELPQDILAYLILFKLLDTLQLLKRQIMHSDKALTVQFVCNHLTQFNNKNCAETKEASSNNQAALISTRNQRSHRNNENQGGQAGTGASGGPRRCTTGYHNPKQDPSSR